jgi:hypothetical protein
MGFTFAYLKRGLPLAFALAAVFPSQAQRSAYHTLQPIVFSAPDRDSILSNMPSLTLQQPEPLDWRKTMEAPPSLNLGNPPVDTLPPPDAPTMSRAEMLRMQEQQDRRKNWMLLTPGEILGATTPEKIMGIQERDSAGRPKNLTALERYNERRNQVLTTDLNTNLMPAWNHADRQSEMSNLFIPGPGRLDNPPGLLLNPEPDNSTFGAQNDNNSWSRLFGSPLPAPMALSATTTNMDRFRQLLKSGSSPVAAAAAPLLGNTKAPLPQTALSSGLGQSALTPVGASFTPLNSGIGRPAELPKLPSIWSQSLTSPPAAAVWAPQPPPWLSPTPQPFAAPQRKF